MVIYMIDFFMKITIQCILTVSLALKLFSAGEHTGGVSDFSAY